MRKVLKCIYILIIMVALCLPVGLMGFYESAGTENRELAGFPDEINEDFGKNMNSYLEDNFAFRDRLVSADSSIKASVFQMGGNDKVAVGKDGWLFFAEDIDGLTSKNTLSGREIFCISRELEMIRDYAGDNGSSFLFMIAPDKAGLYSEYLPYYYKESTLPDNKEMLEAMLDKDMFIDLSLLFENEKEVLYHRLDSHWNNKGAQLVVNAMLDRLGLDKKEYAQPTESMDWEGDLYKMLYPLGEEKDKQYNYSGFEYSYAKRFKSTDDMLISTKNPKNDNGSILLFRDSFGRNMLPFIGDNFSEAELARAVPYDFNRLSQRHFDYAVLEIAERNVDELLDKAPYIIASEADEATDELLRLDESEYELVVEEKDECCHLYGVINSPLETAARIYVKTADMLFEAFPCYEKEKGKFEYKNGNGFSIYIDKALAKDKTEIFIGNNGG